MEQASDEPPRGPAGPDVSPGSDGPPPGTDPAAPQGSATLTVLFVSALPFITFYARNVDELVQTRRLALYALAGVMVSLSLYGVGLAIAGRRRAGQVALTTSAALLSLWGFGLLHRAVFSVEPSQRMASVVVIAWSVGATFLAWIVGRNRWVLEWAALATGLLCLVTIVPAVAGGRNEAPAFAALPAPVDDPTGDPPDVFHIVVDGYGGSDSIAEVFSTANDAFLDRLRGHGFDVPEKAYSSYGATRPSLSTVLSMDYAQTPEHDWISNDLIQGDNRVVAAFRELGYRIVIGEPGNVEWAVCRGHEDRCVEPLGSSGVRFGELEQSLLNLTVLGPHGLSFGLPDTDEWNEPERVVARALDLKEETGDPVYTYLHLLRPHRPYLFDRNCDRADDSALPDADERVQRWENVECLNRQLASAIELILDASPGAIILIHGDHGSDFLADFGTRTADWSDRSLRERYSILAAMRLPPGCPSFTGRAVAPPNFLRVILGCIWGEPVPLLDFRAFGSSGSNYWDPPIDDITDRVIEAADGVDAAPATE